MPEALAAGDRSLGQDEAQGPCRGAGSPGGPQTRQRDVAGHAARAAALPLRGGPRQRRCERRWDRKLRRHVAWRARLERHGHDHAGCAHDADHAYHHAEYADHHAFLSISILTVTLGASVAQPRSIEVRDELGGRRALGNALLLHGTPEVEQAEHRLRLAQTQDLATSRSLEQRYR